MAIHQWHWEDYMFIVQVFQETELFESIGVMLFASIKITALSTNLLHADVSDTLEVLTGLHVCT